MSASTKKNKPDIQIKFSDSENTGVVIQFSFKRAIFYVKGITKDYFYFFDDDQIGMIEEWINNKRELYEKEKGALQCASEE